MTAHVTVLDLVNDWARIAGVVPTRILDEIIDIARLDEFPDLSCPVRDGSARGARGPYRIGDEVLPAIKIARLLYHAVERHALPSGKIGDLGNELMRSISVSADSVRAYCRRHSIVVPDCVRRCYDEPRIALENALAIYAAPHIQMSLSYSVASEGETGDATVGNNAVSVAEEVHSATPAKAYVPQPGRIIPKHPGLRQQDQPIVARAVTSVRERGISAWAAVQEIPAEEIAGSGAPLSRRKRIYKQVRATNG
jgi:hypothetical protein